MIDATANPYKFNAGVLEALTSAANVQGKDEFQLQAELHQLTGQPVHGALCDLDKKPVHLRPAIDKGEIKGEILKIIGLQG